MANSHCQKQICYVYGHFWEHLFLNCFNFGVTNLRFFFRSGSGFLFYVDVKLFIHCFTSCLINIQICNLLLLYISSLYFKHLLINQRKPELTVFLVCFECLKVSIYVFLFHLSLSSSMISHGTCPFHRNYFHAFQIVVHPNSW